MITRRALFAASAALAATGGARGAIASGPPLALSAKAAGLVFGASIDDSAFSHLRYGALYARETALVATDVAFKFDWLRPAPDRYDFSRADRIVDWAEKSGKSVRGHCLIWNDNAPDWLRRLSGAEVERVFDSHLEAVVSRYRGRVALWDVVNEPFWPMAGIKGGWRDGPWFAAMGPSYVARAFRRVGAVDPHAKLALNEAQCDNDRSWGRAIRPLLAGLVDDLLAGGVKLDVVGLQSHLHPGWPHDWAEFARYADGFGRRGLAVHLSEFDVDDEGFPDGLAERDAAVADATAAFLRNALSTPAVKAVVTWQLADRFTYYRELRKRAHPSSPRRPRPLPFDDDYAPTRMRDAMLAAFAGRAAR